MMKPGDLAQCKDFIMYASFISRVDGIHTLQGELFGGDVMIILEAVTHYVTKSPYFFVLTRLGFGFIYEGFIERVIPDACVESLRSA